MTPQPTSPRTAAGRALLARMHPEGRAEQDGSQVMALIALAYDANRDDILAIEAEAAAPADALLRTLVGALDVYRAQWQTTSTGWGPVSEATAEARAYLEGQK